MLTACSPVFGNQQLPCMKRKHIVLLGSIGRRGLPNIMVWMNSFPHPPISSHFLLLFFLLHFFINLFFPILSYTVYHGVPVRSKAHHIGEVYRPTCSGALVRTYRTTAERRTKADLSNLVFILPALVLLPGKCVHLFDRGNLGSRLKPRQTLALLTSRDNPRSVNP